MRPMACTSRRACRLIVLALACAAGACDDPSRPDRVDALEVSAPSEHLDVGQTVSLEARVSDPAGAELERARVEWSSSDPAVAAVAAGQVTGRAPGQVTIRASAGGRSDSVRLTVELPVAGISVAPDSAVLLAGRSGALFVDLTDASGQPMAHSLTMTSSAPAVVAVEGGRTLRGVAEGGAVVTVRAGTKSLEVPVRVAAGDRFRVRVLGTLGGDTSRAAAVNNRREVVGESRTAGSGALRPFLWRRGTMVDLGVPAGDTHALASDVSDRGEVVGLAHRPHPDPSLNRPVHSVWRWRGGTRSLLALPPEVQLVTPGICIYYWLTAPRVNESGDVLLDHHNLYAGCGGGSHGTVTTYVLRGAAAQATETIKDHTAGGINAEGTVAVTRWANVSYGIDPAAHLYRGGQNTAGPKGMVARAISDRGLVVGRCGTWPSFTGCTWDGTTQRTLAGTTDAVAVNAHGDVLALGADGSPVLVRGATVVRLADAVGAGWELLAASDVNEWGEVSATAKSRATGQV
ncbi:MAG TPA: Ig-like domain-containing protein, partial [Longimicrobiaceae bacterium]|nr:Ig-like domain-containing protein [Longimicrobiaceae bacterium]